MFAYKKEAYINFWKLLLDIENNLENHQFFKRIYIIIIIRQTILLLLTRCEFCDESLHKIKTHRRLCEKRPRQCSITGCTFSTREPIAALKHMTERHQKSLEKQALTILEMLTDAETMDQSVETSGLLHGIIDVIN